MSTKRQITFSVHSFGEDLTGEVIREWQDAGIIAIWRATRELSEVSLALRGSAPGEALRKDVFLKLIVPWEDAGADKGRDA